MDPDFREFLEKNGELPKATNTFALSGAGVKRLSNQSIIISIFRYLVRTAAHPVLRMDPDFREFLEKDGELPKATNTSALSGAGVKRLLSKVGDAMEKITFKMDESDEVRYFVT